MDPETAALLASGATSLVNAAATKAGNGVWDLVRPRLARLFGGGDVAKEGAALRRLNATAAVLEQATDEDRDQIWDEQRDAWRTRMADFLEEHEDAEVELAALLAKLNTKLSAAQTTYEQRNTAHNAPVFATQGRGSQIVIHQQPPASHHA